MNGVIHPSPIQAPEVPSALLTTLRYTHRLRADALRNIGAI